MDQGLHFTQNKQCFNQKIVWLVTFECFPITGKGLRSKSVQDPYVSKDLSKLRYSVPEYINNSSDLKNKIKKISNAETIDGGEGAFYVFLKN